MCRVLTTVLVAFVAFGCATANDTTSRTRRLAVEGKVASISAADIAAVVAAMDGWKIYRLRVINRDRIEVDTSPRRYTIIRRRGSPPEVHSVQYTVVKRIRGVWTAGEFYITSF